MRTKPSETKNPLGWAFLKTCFFSEPRLEEGLRRSAHEQARPTLRNFHIKLLTE